MRVAFLGNCQAQAMESWSMQAKDELDIASMPAIWLIEETDVERIIDCIDSCDYVFTQRLSDEFARQDLATSRLKQRYPEKIISWPNAYFDGYFPGISYRYSTDGKILGPLDEYHWDLIEKLYLEGSSAKQCAAMLASEEILDHYPDPIGASLQNLSDRESGLDIIISDYIANYLHHERLFYSMNHPISSLMLEMMHRMFGMIGERKRLEPLGEFGYPLNKIILPVLPAISYRNNITFPQEIDKIKGVQVAFHDGKYKVTDNIQYYSLDRLVETFYRIYDTVHNNKIN